MGYEEHPVKGSTSPLLPLPLPSTFYLNEARAVFSALLTKNVNKNTFITDGRYIVDGGEAV